MSEDGKILVIFKAANPQYRFDERVERLMRNKLMSRQEAEKIVTTVIERKEP